MAGRQLVQGDEMGAGDVTGLVLVGLSDVENPGTPGLDLGQALDVDLRHRFFVHGQSVWPMV